MVHRIDRGGGFGLSTDRRDVLTRKQTVLADQINRPVVQIVVSIGRDEWQARINSTFFSNAKNLNHYASYSNT